MTDDGGVRYPVPPPVPRRISLLDPLPYGGNMRRLVRFCSQECEWQLVSPLAVADMIDAYFYLFDQIQLTPSVVRKIGSIIEDVNSPDEWRQVGVRVGRSIKPHFLRVPDLMEQFLAKAGHPAGDPVELFREFEEIHPFRDGNGRTGALLFNWWNGTYNPGSIVLPPDLWSDERRNGVSLTEERRKNE